MSDERTPTRGRLREHVAEEIRVLLARKRISASELARRTGIKQSTMSRRMTGETAFDMDDLEVIAAVLEVEVSELLPQGARTGGHRPSPNYRSSTPTRSARSMPRSHATSRPNGHKPAGPKRPGSPVPAAKRRPTLIGPRNRPM